MSTNYVNFIGQLNFNGFPESNVLSLAEVMLIQYELRAKNYPNFKALFSVIPNVVSGIWGVIKDPVPKNSHPMHFLWTLLFYNVYNT